MAKVRREGKSTVSTDPVHTGQMKNYEKVPVKRGEVGPSESQAGKGSSPSSKTDETKESAHSHSPRKHAPTTESHSNKGQGEPSTVDSTAGSGHATKAQPSVKKAAKKATTRSTEDEDF